MSFCTLCQKTFKNSSSLASHRYKFHPSDDKSSNANGSNRKVLLPNPTFRMTTEKDLSVVMVLKNLKVTTMLKLKE